MSDTSPLDTLDWGTRTESNTIHVYFRQEGDSEFINTTTHVYPTQWNDYETQRVKDAFSLYENYIDVEFVYVDNEADADFVLMVSQFSRNYSRGIFAAPGEEDAGRAGFFRSGRGWDENGEGGLDDGGLGFQTILHEIGHGMGLAHPHDEGGTSTRMAGIENIFQDTGDYDLNQTVFTVMSYVNGWKGGPMGSPSDYTYGHMASLGALDIAVLQDKYGANTDYNSGNNVYRLGEDHYEAIWDTGGRDTISAAGLESDAWINLNAATLDYSSTGGGSLSALVDVNGGFTIASGTQIENARGGNGDDVLIGNKNRNVLIGGNGADTFIFFENFGRDVVRDFAPGEDKMIFKNMPFDSFDDLLAATKDCEDFAFIYFGNGNALRINDQDINLWQPEDFGFYDIA